MDDGFAALVSRVAPDGAQAAQVTDAGQEVPLHPGEACHVADAAPVRRRDFALGRFCAHAALDRLGLPGDVIARSAGGAPVWPAGAVGSITHTRGHAAALVGRTNDFLGIGVDAEQCGDMRDDIVPLLFGAAERAWLKTLNDDARMRFATVCFSAKESCYKVWSPLTGQPLSFQQLHIAVDAEGFTATLADTNLADWRGPLRGRFAIGNGLVVTSLCLRRGG